MGMMMRLLVSWMVALFAATAAFADLPPRPSVHHMHVALVAETQHPAPGKALTIAVVMTPDPGWHGYWLNPGEAGFPPKLEWTWPNGFLAEGAPQYPVPERLRIGGLMNHVFNGEHALLQQGRVDNGMATGTPLLFKLHVNLLVCSPEVCVPGEDTLALNLTTGDGQRDPAQSANFDKWRAALPRPLDADKGVGAGSGHYAASGKTLHIALPYPAAAPAPADPWLFAEKGDIIDNGGTQSFRRSGDWLIADVVAGPGAAAGTAMAAVLSTGAGKGLSFTAVPGAVPEGGSPIGPSDTKPAPISALTLLAALGGALLGGLILNIMPCVFPVIGLKALSLAKANIDERAARRDALAYTGGVILTCLALGGIMLGLRAAGQAVGWAFQLQQPAVILVLLALMVAITANLAGLFELGTISAGDTLTHKGGIAGTFWTGALAAFVATPCTGPFMAAALGAALVLPVAAALLIFAGLGLGLASPFLAIGFIPAIRTRLPKPGAWMGRVRLIMAVPMGLTALALLWLLWREGGTSALVGGIMVTSALITAMELIGRRQREGKTAGWLVPAMAFAIVVLGAAALAMTPKPATTDAATATGDAQPFSEARLSALQAQHRAVFVYFTADWCLTCKVNEKVAIDTQGVQDAFKAHNIAVLEGDWTNGDPTISHFLNDHGRSGVPYYLFYPANGTAPQELPQVLTPGIITSSITGAP